MGKEPTLDMMTQGLHQEPYSVLIKSAAYGTAFLNVSLIVFLYYHTQHLLPIKSKLGKALIVACILLEIKGNLIRLPIMDVLVNYSFGMHGLEPFKFVGLNKLDQWISNLFIAFCLVYLCPKNRQTGARRG